jgi:hypothetical protein
MHNDGIGAPDGAIPSFRTSRVHKGGIVARGAAVPSLRT